MSLNHRVQNLGNKQNIQNVPYFGGFNKYQTRIEIINSDFETKLQSFNMANAKKSACVADEHVSQEETESDVLIHFGSFQKRNVEPVQKLINIFAIYNDKTLTCSNWKHSLFY